MTDVPNQKFADKAFDFTWAQTMFEDKLQEILGETLSYEKNWKGPLR